MSKRNLKIVLLLALLCSACTPGAGKEQPQAVAVAAAAPTATVVAPPVAAKTVQEQAQAVLNALQARDMAALVGYVHPQGVRFSPYTFVRETDQVFLPAQIAGLYDDPTVYDWSNYDGSGQTISLPFAAYYAKFVYDHDYVNAAQVGYNERLGVGNSLDNSREFYPEAVVLDYHFPGFDPDYAGMDWASLRLIFQQVGDEWLLVGIIHDSWTI